jgi:hypothetical protein
MVENRTIQIFISCKIARSSVILLLPLFVDIVGIFDHHFLSYLFLIYNNTIRLILEWLVSRDVSNVILYNTIILILEWLVSRDVNNHSKINLIVLYRMTLETSRETNHSKISLMLLYRMHYQIYFRVVVLSGSY